MAPSALMLLTALAFQAPAAPFESKAGGFRVAMPSPPTETTQEVRSALGAITVHFFQAQKGEVAYIASYSDYPPGVAEANPAKTLEGAAKAAVGGMKGAGLIRSTDIRLGETPGKETEFTIPRPNGAEGQARSQLYLVGSRMYSLLVIGPRRQVSQAADGFFRSFAFTSSGPPEAAAGPTATATPAMPKGAAPGPGLRPGLGAPGVDKRPAGANRPGMSRPDQPPAVAAPGTLPPARAGAAKPFISEEHNFRVALPSKPMEKKITQQSPAGPINVFVFALPPGAEGISYVVTATKMPEQARNADPRKGLAVLVDSSVRGAKGTLVSQKDISLGADPGKEFDYTATDAGGATSYFRSRAYYTNGRLYQLVANGPQDRVTGTPGKAFLDSFTVNTP